LTVELLLWRHAEAEDGMPDLDRPLTPKGRKQAAKVATWLDRHLPDNCRVLVSPALRAQQTALALGRKMKTVQALAPGASVADVLRAAEWPEARECVLVVGHQPGLGEVAAYLLSSLEQDWSMKKGAVFWISNREREGSDRASLRAVVSADML
jgi:phosphohistidine phosphatase